MLSFMDLGRRRSLKLYERSRDETLETRYDVQLYLDPGFVFCLGCDRRVVCLCTGVHDVAISIVVDNGWDLAVPCNVLLTGESALGDGRYAGEKRARTYRVTP